MIQISLDNSFAAWREAARGLLYTRASPDHVIWSPGEQNNLFDESAVAHSEPGKLRVPTPFFKLAEAAACVDDLSRWDVLYRVLYRLVFENANLLSIESDPDVRRMHLMAKAVRRDIHKFHAFVRFRRVECDGKEIFVAWYEPQHFTVEAATPFFARRFGTMIFSILTPKGCAHWDREELTFSPPVDRTLAPSHDETEDFWLLYYRSIFNPFRLKVNAMKKELLVRHWPTLPEARLIPELIEQSRANDQTR